MLRADDLSHGSTAVMQRRGSEIGGDVSGVRSMAVEYSRLRCRTARFVGRAAALGRSRAEVMGRSPVQARSDGQPSFLGLLGTDVGVGRCSSERWLSSLGTGACEHIRKAQPHARF